MIKEQQFFLNILSDFINNRKTKPTEDAKHLDWSLIIKYAQMHKMEGIIKYQCKALSEISHEINEYLRTLELAEKASAFLYLNYLSALNELTEVFKKENIRFFCIKGLDIAALYPVPAFRTMGDIDIVMSAEDRVRIYDLMLSLGYSKIGEGYEHKYRRGDVKLEIHDHLLYKQNLEIKSRKKYFNDFWKYVQQEQDGRYKLDWGFHFLFLIEHAKQHFSANGVGFRQFMDLAIAAQNISDLDWEWIEGELRKIGLWHFTTTAFGFLERWWGIKLPLPSRIIENNFYEESTEFIFKNGVFGFDNENFKLHFLEKKMYISQLPKPLRPFRMVANKIFIPYSKMSKLPYCSFVINKKYLLPAAWVYRLFYVAVNKRENVQIVKKMVFGSDEILEYHRDLMDQWGI